MYSTVCDKLMIYVVHLCQLLHPVQNCAVITVCLWMQLFEFAERVSGARMHAAYIRPGGVSQVTMLLF